MPHKWAKLIRFVDGKEIDNLLCSYDPVKNILRINREMYDLLPEPEKLKVWRSNANIELRVK